MCFVCAGKSWDKVASSALRHNQQPAFIEEFIVQRSSRICSLDPLASWAISFCIPARSNSALQYTPLRLRPPQGDTARLFRTRLTYATNRTRLTARPPSSLFSQLPTHFHTRAKGDGLALLQSHYLTESIRCLAGRSFLQLSYPRRPPDQRHQRHRLSAPPPFSANLTSKRPSLPLFHITPSQCRKSCAA